MKGLILVYSYTQLSMETNKTRHMIQNHLETTWHYRTWNNLTIRGSKICKILYAERIEMLCSDIYFVYCSLVSKEIHDSWVKTLCRSKSIAVCVMMLSNNRKKGNNIIKNLSLWTSQKMKRKFLSTTAK